jgi:hypothetical protein
MKDAINIISTLAAIGAITFLEYQALLKGIDGAYLSVVIAVLAGLGGYKVKELFKK